MESKKEIEIKDCSNASANFLEGKPSEFLKCLNVETRRYEENCKDGLMICGRNWGGNPDKNANQPTPDIKLASFFSDWDRRYTYKNKIVSWFDWLGHPLKRYKFEVCIDSQAGGVTDTGQFERSLLQTNWLATQSEKTNRKQFKEACVNEWGNFSKRLALLNPKLIIFFGFDMLEILNSDVCSAGVHRLFGCMKKLCVWGRAYDKLHPATTEFTRIDRIGVQYFERVTIIALPHPSTPINRKYIEAYGDVLAPIICKYKSERGFKLPVGCKRLWPAECPAISTRT